MASSGMVPTAETLLAALPFAVIMILLVIGLIRQMTADSAGVTLVEHAPALRERLKSILIPPQRGEIERQLLEQGTPALEAIPSALASEDQLNARVESSLGEVDLTVRPETGEPFRYRLAAEPRPLPAFSPLGAPDDRRSHEWRLIGRVGRSGPRRDVTGLNREQLISDVLEQLRLWRRTH